MTRLCSVFPPSWFSLRGNYSIGSEHQPVRSGLARPMICALVDEFPLWTDRDVPTRDAAVAVAGMEIGPQRLDIVRTRTQRSIEIGDSTGQILLETLDHGAACTSGYDQPSQVRAITNDEGFLSQFDLAWADDGVDGVHMRSRGAAADGRKQQDAAKECCRAGQTAIASMFRFQAVDPIDWRWARSAINELSPCRLAAGWTPEWVQRSGFFDLSSANRRPTISVRPPSKAVQARIAAASRLDGGRRIGQCHRLPESGSQLNAIALGQNLSHPTLLTRNCSPLCLDGPFVPGHFRASACRNGYCSE